MLACVCVFVYACVCVFDCVFASLIVCLCGCLSERSSMYVSLFVCVWVCLFRCVFVCLSRISQNVAARIVRHACVFFIVLYQSWGGCRGLVIISAANEGMSQSAQTYPTV